MMSNFKKVALVTAVTLALSACSEESEDTSSTGTTNAFPTLSLETNSGTINEGEAVKITFNADDDGGAPSVSLQMTDLVGDAVISGNSILYTAPWLSSESTLTETFTVIATDTSGQKTSQEVTITVLDKNEPVSLKVSPPSQARGFENTRTDTSLNFWIDEGQENVTLTYDLVEKDADVLNISYQLGDESFIFKNNILASQTTDGDNTQVTLAFALPKITDSNSVTSSPSQDVTVTLQVDDGDDVVSAEVNMTVVNVVDLSWAAGNPSSISEASGGTLYFDSSESFSYPGEYQVQLLDSNGRALDFDLPYTLDTQARTITFGESDGIVGDQSVEVIIKHINTISNAAGESYDATFSASRTITVVDDRDDGFFAYEEAHETNLALFADMRARRDEDRVAQAATSYLFMNGWISETEVEVFTSEVSQLLDSETQELADLADDIDEALNAGIRDAAVQDLMDSFQEGLYALGHSAREFMGTKYDEYSSLEENAEKSLSLGRLSAAKTALLYDNGNITHYVGNSVYGRYENDEQWVFDTSYGYLAVVDITDSYCF